MSKVVTTQRHDRVVVAHCHGDLDLATRDALAAGLASVLGPDVDAVVVDLTEAPFLDCAALTVLVALAREASRAGANVLLSGATPIVRRLLTTLELDRLLVLSTTVDEAVTLAQTWADLPHHRPEPPDVAGVTPHPGTPHPVTPHSATPLRPRSER